ncbi:unnamed protein product, partial [Adineta steineri]
LNNYDIPADFTLNENEQLLSFSSSNSNINQDDEDERITGQESSDEDLINTEDHNKEFTFSSFEKHYIRFLLDLREGHLLPQGIIKSITSYFTAMLDALFKLIENQAIQSSTNPLISLVDIGKVLLQIKNLIYDISKNDYQFLKRCTDYFGYTEPLKIELDDKNNCGYYVSIEKSIQNLLNKPDIINYLIDNVTNNISQTKNDPDLMLTYRDGTAAIDNPSLKLHPNSFLIQLYSDGIGITNPLGPKKDKHKLTLYYFLLEDLLDFVKSMLQSIGLVGICPTKFLSIQTNRMKFFEPIINDLNHLQTTGLVVQTFNGQLHFAFSLFAADNLASNEIGGFQQNFNSGQFCRLCHISYKFRLIPLTDISFLPRTVTTNDAYVRQAVNLFNTRPVAGVVGESPLSKLIAFHAIKSLPNDLMHDYAEGVCPLIVLAMLKEISAKRLMTYNQTEQKIHTFSYGMNDQVNKPPTIRPTHLTNNNIIGSASQKLYLFKLMPFIFHDVIDQLTNTLDIYTCLREIISYTCSIKFRKSWLMYFQSLTIRFQSLMAHHLPDLIIPKIHFVTEYLRTINANGPATRFWCMRFEEEEIDGATLARLPYDEVRTLFPNLKDRILFTEKRDLLIKQCDNIANEQLDDGDILNQSSKQTFDTCTALQSTTSTQDLLNNPSLSSNNMNGDEFDTASNIDDEVNHDETDDLEEPQQNLPTDFAFSSLPEEIQVIIDENKLMKLRGHTNHRRILLNFVFKAVATTYNLLYPEANDYFLITQTLLKALNISTTDANAANEWREAVKQKFKNGRRLLQNTSAVVQRKKEKFGKDSGRFAKKSEALSAERKSDKMIYVSTIMDESDVEQLIITMNEGIENETIHNDELITLWKKTFGYRRSFVRSHTINEILDKFPGYSYTHFMFEEVKMIENIDIEQNVNEILPRLFDKLPNNSLFVIGETTSPTTALALLLSLYNVFSIKFAKNNHTSHLLYGVFFQNGDELGKNLRIILNSWHFTFEDRIKHSQIQATNVIDSVSMPSTSNLQVRSTSATTTEIIQSSIILNNKENQSPTSPQSIPLIIDEQEEQ